MHYAPETFKMLSQGHSVEIQAFICNSIIRKINFWQNLNLKSCILNKL